MTTIVRAVVAACTIITLAVVAYYAAWFGWHPQWMQDGWANRCHDQGGHVVDGGRGGDDLCVLSDGRVASWRG